MAAISGKVGSVSQVLADLVSERQRLKKYENKNICLVTVRQTQ